MSSDDYIEDVNWACKLCGSTDKGASLKVKEMQLGYGDEFSYSICSNCGCMQLDQVLNDLSKYYPHDYYSFRETDNQRRFSPYNKLQEIISKVSAKGSGHLYDYLSFLEMIDQSIYSVSQLKLEKSSSILDVGCGSGHLLRELKYIGYENLHGIDPFATTETRGSINVRRASINDLTEDDTFDIIMFHHSLEHMPNQLEALEISRDHLTYDGKILVRIPVLGYALEKYGSSWYSIDAPRHLYIHSMKSFEYIVNKAQLKLSNCYHDSSSVQFTFSEAYQKGIPMSHISNNWYLKIMKKVISPSFRAYHNSALDLNAGNRGDQAVFYLSKME